MKQLLKILLAVTLFVQSQYVIDGKLFCDFVLQGEQYKNVYYEDMFDALNTACEIDVNNALKAAGKN